MREGQALAGKGKLGSPRSDLACGQDLEGIVAKHRDGEYGHRWLKMKNPHYTQVIGRSEKFQRRMRA
jgi:ATP-dependent DNA ligase